MPVKKVKYSYSGMNQDVTKSKHPFQFYYEANNIKITSSTLQSTASVTNEEGNDKIIKLPTLCIDTTLKKITYGDKELFYNNEEIDSQINDNSVGICDEINTLPICSGTEEIIGHALTKDGLILFSTDNNGFDCIWEIKQIFVDSYDLKLLYCRNLGFSKDTPIQAIFNFENKIIQKIYWVDGVSQLRFLNIKHSIDNGDIEELIDVSLSNLKIVGKYSLSQPTIPQITNGGFHTAGNIQYAYNLYKLNGAQTTISPLSKLISLDYGVGLGGGSINEIVGSSPLIHIDNIDSKYTHIKLYAIKYTSFNQIPSISLIAEKEIQADNSLSFFDDGNIISSLSLSEFLFLGSNPFIPKHIQTKDNRMFATNLIDKPYNLDIDMRAYGHDINHKVVLWKNVSINNNVPIPGGILNDVELNYNVPKKHDCINPNYNDYKYQIDNTKLGGEGKYIKYEIVQKTENNPIESLKLKGDLKYLQFLKDNEIYRIGIEFFNILGQRSFPLWIADLKSPEGNLIDKYNTLSVTLKPELFTHLDSLCLKDSEKPVGYRILRADRKPNDRTILCQGGITSMVCQTTRESSNWRRWQNYEENRRAESENLVMIPTFFMKGMVNEGAYSKLGHLRYMSYGNDDNEVFSEAGSSQKKQHTWQFTKIMQLHSPDLLFNTGLSFGPTLKLHIRGLAKKKLTNLWHHSVNKNSLTVVGEAKRQNVVSFNRGDDVLWMFGSIGPSRDNISKSTENMNFKQYYHDCSEFIPAVINKDYYIFGTPELTSRGQGTTSYNNQSKFKYNNTLLNFITDKKISDGSKRDNEESIISINSHGSKCLTLMVGDEDVDIQDRDGLEDMWLDSNLPITTGLLVADVRYPDYYPYVGNIYGGNSYESKSTTSYLEIGSYTKITDTTINIESPGDTFVQSYKVARLSKTDTEVINVRVMQFTEIIEFKVETSVNLKNRNDISLQSWDGIKQPRYEQYHSYNRVYSQQPTLIQNTDVSFKLKKNASYSNRIIASKLKIPGETIDSYTDFLENEILDMDGKYGPINSFVEHNDELYILQDSAVSLLHINPRVQVQSTDGISIELGKGGILDTYKYLTTKSGTLNKWSVFNSPTGFYYLDISNKAWYKFNGSSIINLTDDHGLHSYFNNNINYKDLSIDNPLLKLGSSGGYDLLSNTAYLTVLQKKNSFTLSFNDNTNSFISFHSYKPSMYINKGSIMITTSPDINKLYEHGKGEYQTFYDEKYPSTITLQINPESDLDCVFNNIEYKSEIYLNDIDQPQSTLTHLTAWNEYQKTNRIPLILGNNKNLRRKFRNWAAQIPREAGTRNRIRNPWIFLKLELDTTDNYKMILHDLVINYTI